VSDDDNPHGVWAKYIFDATLLGGEDLGVRSDFPAVGGTAGALVVTTDMMTRDFNVHAYARILVLSRTDLLNFQATIAATEIWFRNDPEGFPVFSLQPALHFGAWDTPLVVHATYGDQMIVYGITDPFGDANLIATLTSLPAFEAPPNAAQPGGIPRLSTVDSRASNVVWRDGALYFAHTIKLNHRAAIRWYEVDTANWPATLAITQSGDLAADNAHQWFPSIAVDADRTIMVGFCRSSMDEYASSFYAYRGARDELGTMRGPFLVKAGVRRYTGETAPVARWGDYSSTVADPAQPRAFWNYNMLPDPADGNLWTTWVQQIETPQFCPADIDLDGDVDVGDIGLLLQAFGHCQGEPLFNPLADIDGDGCVALVDVTAAIAEFRFGCD